MPRNPNRDDLSKIKNWISKRETETEIASKSKARVHDAMARQLRTVKPLPVGICHICGTFADRLIPVVMKCCMKCCKKFIKKSGGLRVTGKHIGNHYCDKCLMMTMLSFTVNPLICNKCTGRIGKTHKFGLKDFKKEREKTHIKARKVA